MNGFWASLGPGVPHTAYSAAKFAVKGFTEALMEDFRVNAPHVKVAVVMPGHIGTDIVLNSREILGVDLDGARTQMARRGLATDGMSDDDIQNLMKTVRRDVPRQRAALSRAGRDDHPRRCARREVADPRRRRRPLALDEAVRADPENAYGEHGLNLGTITGS